MKFLTDAWFAKVLELREAKGELDLPPQIANTVINVTITDPEPGVASDLHIKGGDFIAGHHPSPVVTLSLPTAILRDVFLEMNAQAGMQAFFSGQIQIEGDVAKMMELQGYEPNAKQQQLIQEIRAVTD